MTQMGLAGPETLLVGLRKDLKFDLKEEDELDGRKVWKFHGTWKTRQGLVGLDARPVNADGCLAAVHPDGRHALPGQGRRLALQADSRWAEGRRRSSRHAPDRPGRPADRLEELDREDRPAARSGSTYSDVKLNATIRLDEFAFQAPPTASVDDNTEAIVKGLDQAISRSRAQQKKSEAAKKDGAVLDQPIDVPAAGAATATRSRDESIRSAIDLSSAQRASTDVRWRQKADGRRWSRPNRVGAKPSKVEAIKLASQYLKTFVADELDNGTSHFSEDAATDPQVPRVVPAGRSRPPDAAEEGGQGEGLPVHGAGPDRRRQA